VPRGATVKMSGIAVLGHKKLAGERSTRWHSHSCEVALSRST